VKKLLNCTDSLTRKYADTFCRKIVHLPQTDIVQRTYTTLFTQLPAHPAVYVPPPTPHQQDTKSIPNPNPNPNQHTVVSIQLNIDPYPTYPEQFTRCHFTPAPFQPHSLELYYSSTYTIAISNSLKKTQLSVSNCFYQVG